MTVFLRKRLHGDPCRDMNFLSFSSKYAKLYLSCVFRCLTSGEGEEGETFAAPKQYFCEIFKLSSHFWKKKSCLVVLSLRSLVKLPSCVPVVCGCIYENLQFSLILPFYVICKLNQRLLSQNSTKNIYLKCCCL